MNGGEIAKGQMFKKLRQNMVLKKETKTFILKNECKKKGRKHNFFRKEERPFFSTKSF